MDLDVICDRNSKCLISFLTHLVCLVGLPVNCFLLWDASVRTFRHLLLAKLAIFH